jgi:hypothetical protein
MRPLCGKFMSKYLAVLNILSNLQGIARQDRLRILAMEFEKLSTGGSGRKDSDPSHC